MRILAIAIAGATILFGVRLIVTSLRTAFTGKILMRQGLKSRWVPVPNFNDALKIAFRDGLLGLLMVVLGVVLLT